MFWIIISIMHLFLFICWLSEKHLENKYRKSRLTSDYPENLDGNEDY